MSDSPSELVPRSRSRPSAARPLSMPPQAYNLTIPPGASTPRSTTPVNARPQPDDSASIRRRDPNAKSTRSSHRLLGDYMLTKLLGAGSMGKVKLAIHNVTGDKFAVKILPRVNPAPLPNVDGVIPDSLSKQASKDASKEIRTLREAALSLLLYHPYICGMREMIVHQHHYYMVFEYVNGGQMLDFIISHGRLRERVARKFARQIGSALEYCHMNNVVHRDLKIENILISHTGNIKIIDFGLSNLYDPISRLGTFCGSLYFAAPELLNAKIYTGPEVDIWSFGVVLYVLVCGKVPFDDQSMPALHAKIKRGLVEYPVWLSTECKHIISRMLVTHPPARAPLSEIMSHSWMCRGFNGPPDSHLVHREPLRADELDKQVIRGMKGFEFGTEEEIERKLVHIIESEAYIRAVQAYERKRFGGNGHVGQSLSNSSIAITLDPSSNNVDAGTNGAGASVGLVKQKSKRFSGFEFYRKKLFSPASSPPASPLSNSPPTSQSQLSSTTLVGDTTTREPGDPTRGYHPLISMYYLAREKMERERVYGPGHFASSQLDLHEVPGRTSIDGTGKKRDPVPSGGKADYGMAVPRLPTPATSHFSGMSYDPVPASPSPTVGTFQQAQAQAQPRARDAGLPVPLSLVPGRSPVEGVPQSVPSTPTSAVGVEPKMPRAPPASTHRRSHSLSQRPTTVRGWAGFLGGGGAAEANVAAAVGELGTTEEKKEEEAAAAATPPVSPGAPAPPGDEPIVRSSTPTSAISHSMSAGATFVRRFGHLLVGKGEEGRIRRGEEVGEAGELVRPSTSPGDQMNAHRRAATMMGEVQSPNATVTSPPIPISTTTTKADVGTVGSTKSGRHERRSSMGAPFAGTIGRLRRPSTGYSSGKKATLGDRFFSRTDEEDEGGEDRMPRTAVAGSVMGAPATTTTRGNFKEEDEKHTSEKDFKPVFLKGLFSVATTSTKSPALLKTDIRRVLDRMQIQYRELKTGFECIHLPSIDVSSVQPTTPAPGEPRASLVKKASKLSFGLKRGERGKDREKEDIKEKEKEKDKEKEKELPSRPSIGNAAPVSSRSGSSSFFNVSSNHAVGAEEVSGQPQAQPQPQPIQPLVNGEEQQEIQSPTTPVPTTPVPTTFVPKTLPPIPTSPAVHVQVQSPPIVLPGNAPSAPMVTGEVGQEVFDNLGNNTLSVRFEITIVKVPWLPLHGIQFRRASGDGWQYQMLARRVLTELKL